MRRVSFSEFGGPEVLQVVEVEKPLPAAGQIRIAVRATSINPVDWRIREGSYRTAASVVFPSGIGQDAAGVVDQIGEGVDGIDIGDKVFGRGIATYAEFAVLNSWARMPDGLSFEEASGYPSAFETALRLIRESALQPGQTLLVSGAAGGVGSAVLQIARDRGIRVIGTASEGNLEYLRSLGADATSYSTGWVERVRASGPIDAALDLAGAGVIPELVELTGDPSRVISIADLEAPRYGVRFSGTASAMQPALAEAAALIARGRLHIPVAKTYSLDDAASAHRDSRAGHTQGRRVITVVN
jgi:NADPH:quinone reductase-like Zn-dependent oxidoreductase